MLNLNQLRVFCEVAKCGSFTVAAQRIGISQPAVSMQVRSFQEAVGLTLFQSEGRNLTLTSAGRALMQLGDRVLSATNDAELFLDELRKDRNKRLRVSTTRTMATYILPPVMNAFNALHKNISVHIELCTSDAAYQAVADGQSDIAFVVDAPRKSSLARKSLFTNPLILIGRSHETFSPNVSKLDFREVTLILREPGSKTRQAADRALKAGGALVNQILELADVEAIKTSVRAGVGISIVPLISVQEELANKVLFSHTFLDGSTKLSFDAVYRRDETSPVKRAFLTALLRVARPSR